ncbi:MAG: hypothetical protein IT436_12740 [Phycisphaerales bacterium]|nr:hypothetical protein [Phycisphaerales bacterium]
MRRPSARPAFTLTELAITIAASAGLLTVVSMMLGAGAQPDADTIRAQSIQLKDATQIRGIHQGIIIFAQNNQDVYPLPSRFDKQDMTVAVKGAAKDTSANIMSMLVFAGFIPTDLLISPAESSANIRIYQNYEFNNPAKAQVPAQALWDPAFSVDFTDGQTGYLSYAHQIPATERLARWASTFSATEPIIGNRGPEVAAVRDAGVTIPRDSVPICATKKSMTFRIHGGPDTWEGNIAYNDNHVNFETSLTPADVQYTTLTFNPADGNNQWVQARARDVIFFDEPDALKRENAYLGIFTHAGESTKNFRAIWD